MNMIIVAVIALVVLVIIISIVAGKFKIFGKETKSCGSLGGNCDDECLDGQITYRNTECASKEGTSEPLCCVQFEE